MDGFVIYTRRLNQWYRFINITFVRTYLRRYEGSYEDIKYTIFHIVDSRSDPILVGCNIFRVAHVFFSYGA